jgi:hypothetical protein
MANGMPFGPGPGGSLFMGGAGAAPAAESPTLMNGSSPRPPKNGFGLTKGPSGGKHTSFQDHVSPHSGSRSTITKGEPLMRSLGHYGKMGGFHSTAHLPGQPPVASPLHGIRGGMGQMRRIRGGLGPGRQGQPGASDKDYSMTSMDTE